MAFRKTARHPAALPSHSIACLLRCMNELNSHGLHVLRSNGIKQRTHKCEEREDGGIWVTVAKVRAGHRTGPQP